MLVTGAAGMVGSLVARRAAQQGWEVWGLVRPASDRRLLEGIDIRLIEGDLHQPEPIAEMLDDIDIVVHAAAHIGDWGPAELYREINVVALAHLLTAAERFGRLQRWIQISTLGVYAAGDHFGTDESIPPDSKGLDGYTRTKAEAEFLVNHHVREFQLPGVILRPGFIYGLGERHSLPRLIELFESGKIKFLGDGRKLLNNTYVGNLVDAVFLALDNDQIVGQTFNIRDERLVTREEYLMTVACYLGKPRPGTIPLWLAKAAVPWFESAARLTRQTTPPILTSARIKFMANNLDFSIAKAKALLGYQPRVDFQEGIREALDWATGKTRVVRPRLPEPASALASDLPPCASPN
jgi:nucleoside-diphosphate-sugar epimerase